MIIYGKHFTLADCMVSSRPGGCSKNKPDSQVFVWVAYDNSSAGIPIALASSSEEMARIMGVTVGTVEGNWSHFRHGDIKSARYAKVYIGDEEMTRDQKKIVKALAEHSMNVSEAARATNYHRNSCVYHIEQIKKKTGLDPMNFFDLHELYQIVTMDDKDLGLED